MMSKTNSCLYILVAFLIQLPSDSFAQFSEYRVKALLISKITEYIEWPDSLNILSDTGNVIICIFGDNPFGKSLDDVFIKEKIKIKDKAVTLRYIDDMTKLKNCHILYICSSEKENLTKTLLKTKNKQILTVSDSPGFCEWGVHINFYVQNNKTRFELNESSMLKSGFNVDYHLREVARVVSPYRGRP